MWLPDSSRTPGVSKVMLIAANVLGASFLFGRQSDLTQL